MSTALLKLVPIDVILAYVLEYGRDLYGKKGRAAVTRAATIPEAVIRATATKARTNPDAAVTAGRKFATAFGDFIEAFIPA